MENETIAAIATPPGRSAIAVIRLSAQDAFKIFSQLLHEKDNNALEAQKANLVKLYRVDASETGLPRKFLDQCIVVPYIAPHSYTGENLIEIFSHGGTLVPQLILEELFRAGARLAEPGEFTLRAFLNNKMDLAQAESIELIVSSSTEKELELAHHQYSGQFSQEIQDLRSSLVDLLSLLELELDFSDEDVEFASRSELITRLDALENMLTAMVASYQRSHILREGIYVAIVGSPNVGKSSLLNLLVRKERAIVTDIPGTTRDVIEEAIDISGYKFIFVDTAGFRFTEGVVEQEGIRRSESVLRSAPVVVFMVDQSRHLQKEDWEVRQKILQWCREEDKHKILVVNKSDLPAVISDKEIESIGAGFEIIRLSCKNGQGLSEFEQHFERLAQDIAGRSPDTRSMIVNLRQKNAAERALAAVREGKEHFSGGYSQEFIAADLRIALDALGELIGEVTTEEILGNIFSHFCIGK
ncbi:MAG: tRNA uridine-5-carboxymethylaminomethyl(34) synthesis GTPase MnmE [Calditrichaeota bacterium]|nr:MAG: tRNA uridine-5-carboxymethylaminomethyl(34) synthesis GTPase MnmE [Calditrichota bacterium]